MILSYASPIFLIFTITFVNRRYCTGAFQFNFITRVLFFNLGICILIRVFNFGVYDSGEA